MPGFAWNTCSAGLSRMARAFLTRNALSSSLVLSYSAGGMSDGPRVAQACRVRGGPTWGAPLDVGQQQSCPKAGGDG